MTQTKIPPTIDPNEPRPTDPLFLFAMLLASRKAGDKMLSALIRDWLAAVGIGVSFRAPKGGDR